MVQSGSQPIFFEWFKDNQSLTSAVYKIESHRILSILTLENLQTNSSGLYKCQARNVFGSDFIETNLIVQGLFISAFLFFNDSLTKMWR